MKKLKTSVRFRIYRDAFRRLSQLYPAAFPSRGRRPPLKVGVLRDLVEDPACCVSAGHLRVFLAVWTSSTSYLIAVSRGRERVGADGRTHGAVAPRHAAEAKARLRRRIRGRAAGRRGLTAAAEGFKQATGIQGGVKA